MKGLFLTRPLTRFMDRVSYVETVRQRLLLRRSGLTLRDSNIQETEPDLAELNLQLICGEAGIDVIKEFYNMLAESQLSDDMALWGVSLEECLNAIITGMSDSWRRLVLPFESLPWKSFRILRMPPNTGLEFLRREHQQTSTCAACGDAFFFQATSTG